MKKLNILIIFLLSSFWNLSFCQDDQYKRVYEGSLGFFADDLKGNKINHFNDNEIYKYFGVIFIDFGIGKQNAKKRRLFHFNYKQTQKESTIYLFKYRAFGFDYTKAKKIFSFDRNGLFIGTSFSLDHIKVNGIKKEDPLFNYNSNNTYAAINFKTEYIHFLKDNLQILVGLRLNIIKVGWDYYHVDDISLTGAGMESQPDFPLPFQLGNMNLSIGIGFYKLKSENAK